MIFAALGQRQIFRSFPKTKVTESHLIYATIEQYILLLLRLNSDIILKKAYTSRN